MKAATVNLLQSTAQHGTISAFLLARATSVQSGNLEQLQAFAQEYAGLTEAFATHNEGRTNPQHLAMRPRLRKLTANAIGKYHSALLIWKNELLTADERDAFESAIFVWKP